jgi:hypothetical protein
VTGILGPLLTFLAKYPERWVILPLVALASAGILARAEAMSAIEAVREEQVNVRSELGESLRRQSDTDGTVLFLACRQLEYDVGRSGEACRYLLPDNVRTRLDAITARSR